MYIHLFGPVEHWTPPKKILVMNQPSGGWTNPLEKHYIVKLDHLPRVWGEGKFETTT